ncbi:MAG TPA: class I SAM-dependent methyltransferase [Candidatus Binatia bacterium]|nr:class I SAM-dependent methyltransferase [Candidatus Binatia bacterium]
MAKDAYRLLAGLYDRLVEPAAAALRRQGLKVVPPEENLAILDVGCGTGTQLLLYRRPGCKLTGVDLSPAMVMRARAKLGNDAEIRCEDAAHLSFAAASFDLVMVVTVLHELPPALRSAVVEESARVLKPDGRMLLMDYHTGPYPFPSGWLWKSAITCLEILAGPVHFGRYRDFLAHGGLDGLLRPLHLPIVTRLVPPSGTAAVHVLNPRPVAPPMLPDPPRRRQPRGTTAATTPARASTARSKAASGQAP